MSARPSRSPDVRPAPRALRVAIERSATALTKFMGEPVSIKALGLRQWPLHRLPRALGHPSARVVGIYLGLLGDLDGHVMLLLRPRTAQHVVARLLGAPQRATTEDPLVSSALGEVGNVAVSSFLSVIADMGRFSVRPTPPVVVHDLAGAVLDGIVGDILDHDDLVIAIEVVLEWGGQRGSGALLVFPRPGTLARALQALGASS